MPGLGKLRSFSLQLLSSKRAQAYDEGGLSLYMDPIEYSQLLAVVESIAPRHVLEWGSGGSTRALLEQCPSIERFVSVEHNAKWYDKVRSHVSDARLELVLKTPKVPEPDPPPGPERSAIITEWCRSCESDGSILADYVGFPRTLGIEFQFVLVDGRARVHCIREGFDLLQDGGVLVIHDAQREDYREAIESTGRPVFLEPWKSGQICLLRKP